MTRRTFKSTDGLVDMVSSDRYQRNFYATAEDAERVALNLFRRGRRYYIWKTDEGMFDFSAISDESDVLPWTKNRTLVKEGTTPAWH